MYSYANLRRLVTFVLASQFVLAAPSAFSLETEQRMALPHLVQRGPVVQLDVFQNWSDARLPQAWSRASSWTSRRGMSS